MVKSKYISNILELLLDEDRHLTKQQLPFLTDSKYEYTGSGLFVYFTPLEDISRFKSLKSDLVLDGVKIVVEDLFEANATIFFENGIISYLEIWCYSGNYPTQDLTEYTLTQVWENSPAKVKIV